MRDRNLVFVVPEGPKPPVKKEAPAMDPFNNPDYLARKTRIDVLTRAMKLIREQERDFALPDKEEDVTDPNKKLKLAAMRYYKTGDATGGTERYRMKTEGDPKLQSKSLDRELQSILNSGTAPPAAPKAQLRAAPPLAATSEKPRVAVVPAAPTGPAISPAAPKLVVPKQPAVQPKAPPQAVNEGSAALKAQREKVAAEKRDADKLAANERAEKARQAQADAKVLKQQQADEQKSRAAKGPTGRPGTPASDLPKAIALPDLNKGTSGPSGPAVPEAMEGNELANVGNAIEAALRKKYQNEIDKRRPISGNESEFAIKVADKNYVASFAFRNGTTLYNKIYLDDLKVKKA